MRNRKKLQKYFIIFAIIMIAGMILFTLLPLISSYGS